MDQSNFIAESLAQPKDAIINTISRRLQDEFPEAYILETESQYFRLYTFHFEGKCKIRNKADLHSQWQHDWDAASNSPTQNPYNTWLEVEWEGHLLQVVSIGYFSQYCRNPWHCIVAETSEVAQGFFAAVCAWNSDVRGEVLVCRGDRWEKSKELFEEIQSTTFGDLVLEGGLKDEIVEDLTTFFNSKETYERYGIAWKRGILLLGPPGNGKTHAVKSCINHFKRPCIYAKSFSAQYSSDQDNIERIFDRARELAPCFLVFEDLDSLLNDGNRAFFLNEMDGFASNSGILTIATTNHPDRLDPAILERPSRFDRKYAFDLPGPDGRREFINRFAVRLDSDLRLSEEGEARVSEATDGYSYAYLRELYLSAMMRWISRPRERSIEELMIEQCAVLRSQMATDPNNEVHPDQGLGKAQLARMMAARRMANR